VDPFVESRGNHGIPGTQFSKRWSRDYTKIPPEVESGYLTSFMAARIATDMVDANIAARVLCTT
jgi:hypothetical protein